MLRLMKRRAVSQTQRMVRMLACDTQYLRAKFAFTPPAQKMDIREKPVAEGKICMTKPWFKPLDNKSLVEKACQARKLLSPRWVVDPARVQIINERHQNMMAQMGESVIELKTSSAASCIDRMAMVEKDRQTVNMVNQRRVLDTGRNQYIKERHQQLMAQKRKSVGESLSKGRNLLSLRWAIDPARIQYMEERHQQSMAKVEVRLQNSKIVPNRQELHSGRLSKII